MLSNSDLDQINADKQRTAAKRRAYLEQLAADLSARRASLEAANAQPAPLLDEA